MFAQHKPTAYQNLLLIAVKILVHSKKKLVGMLIGSTLSAFIVMQEPATYQGVCDRLVAQIHAITEVDLWVMGRESWDFTDPTYFNPLDIYRIREIPGVSSTRKIHRGWYSLIHARTNKIMNWEIIGIDPDSLIGLPSNLLEGTRQSIYQPNAIIIDGYALKQMETENHDTIHLGDTLLDANRKLIVTAITKPLRSYATHPKAYMTTDHMRNISGQPYFILVKLMPGANHKLIAANIERLTGYYALTSAEFTQRALKYFREKTPIIIIFTSVAVLGFSIGLAIMWQIFSNFILTHLHQFGMLKMLGVSNRLLVLMVLFQATIIGFVGFILGFILAVVFGMAVYDTNVAYHLTTGIVLLAALGTMLMIAISTYFSTMKIIRLDTVDLCRDLN